MQLQRKLPRTAAIEIAALTVLNRRVNNVIVAAEINGSSKISHGSKLFVVNLIYSFVIDWRLFA
jgi:hypothetical protein